jgi:histidine ammonia-lyase
MVQDEKNPTRQEKSIILDGNSLTLEQVADVARCKAKVKLSKRARRLVQDSAKTVDRLVTSETPVYGVNTGYGLFADQKIEPAQSFRLSRNLILSHIVGIGPPFEQDVVRATMLIRANTLAHGYSGVRPEIIDTLLEMLNHDVTPYIPSQGSLGSSGDLAPLAHLALVMTTPLDDDDDDASQAWHESRLMSGAEAMKSAGINRITLGPKDALAIVNGATFSAALLALACIDTERLLRASEIAATLALESLLGITAAFDPRLHEARPHPGQIAVAERIRKLTFGSELLDTNNQIQDAYSLRCIPQILGSSWDILSFAMATVSREQNSATDNPLIFGNQALSGGNFHGEPIGQAADYIKISLAKVGVLSERRIFRLLSPNENVGLPPMLVAQQEEAGLYSGLMMLQYTAASLTLENRSLATPDSIHSITTSAGKEDINANSTTAARHLTTIISNLYHILAIEFIVASQALDLRLQNNPRAKPGVGTTVAHKLIREKVPFSKEDHPHTANIEAITALIRSGELISTIERTLDNVPLE